MRRARAGLSDTPSGPERSARGDAKPRARCSQARVGAVLAAQIDAWNRSAISMAIWPGHWKSPDLVFFSNRARETRGWQATLDRYRTRYQAEGQADGHPRLPRAGQPRAGPGRRDGARAVAPQDARWKRVDRDDPVGLSKGSPTVGASCTITVGRIDRGVGLEVMNHGPQSRRSHRGKAFFSVRKTTRSGLEGGIGPLFPTGTTAAAALDVSQRCAEVQRCRPSTRICRR